MSLLGFNSPRAVAPNGGEFRTDANDVNAGFDRVAPQAGGSIDTSVPSEITGNGFNLQGLAAQNIVTDPNVGLKGGTPAYDAFNPEARGVFNHTDGDHDADDSY